MVKVYSADYRNILLSTKKNGFPCNVPCYISFFFSSSCTACISFLQNLKFLAILPKHFQSSMCVILSQILFIDEINRNVYYKNRIVLWQLQK